MVFYLGGMSSTHLNGGSGMDTSRIDGSGVTFDLSALANHHITGIERIALSGSGDNALTLDIHDVLALPDHADQYLDVTTHQLLFDGDSGDAVHSTAQGWVQGRGCYRARHALRFIHAR